MYEVYSVVIHFALYQSSFDLSGVFKNGSRRTRDAASVARPQPPGLCGGYDKTEESSDSL